MIKNIIFRPNVVQATKWTGDNKTELEEFYSEVLSTPVVFTVDSEGQLVRAGQPFGDERPVPEGRWFSHIFMAILTDEEFNEQFQVVSGSPPYEFGVSNTPE